jgi:hypothetical protein
MTAKEQAMASKWSTNTTGEQTLWLNDGDVDRARGRVFQADDHSWTGIFVDPVDGTKRRLAQKFEHAADAKCAIDDGIEEGAKSPIWLRLGRLPTKHRIKRSASATVATASAIDQQEVA